MNKILENSYQTRGGIQIKRQEEMLTYPNATESLLDALDTQRGALLVSSFEYPGRYTRWDIGFKNPPLALSAQGNTFHLNALNERGEKILPTIADVISTLTYVSTTIRNHKEIVGQILRGEQHFPEELRSRQPSIFSILRVIIELFFSPEDTYLGLYGAFGYDLAFQFEPIRLRLKRPSDQRDLVLYLPDEIYVVDHRREVATLYRYEFTSDAGSTEGLPRQGVQQSSTSTQHFAKKRELAVGEYATWVNQAHSAFAKGDLFEVVPGQTFYEPCTAPPSELFRRLRERNPAPYGFLFNLGEGEYLVGASPEMYVRATGRRIETCPISGTIARGKDAIGDAEQILKLLNSPKEASELTMCTDVDRNDKSRICEPGSVRVIGRRLIEIYSRLIHTVDHVEGILREGYDALDAFLTHAWAVTVTGAPKTWAMQFIEDHERSSRRWYGGAVGLIGFNGNMNTGLTLRTIRVKDGIAEVRVGATLLFDSIPEEEERETELKASALLDAIRRPSTQPIITAKKEQPAKFGEGKRVLLVDHQDSFVHTLANYLRQTGPTVTTLRPGFSIQELRDLTPDLVVLSPGPGCPKDFNLADTIALVLQEKLPILGVCLGLQGLVEYFGGKLAVLDYPVHGKASEVHVRGGQLFAGLPDSFIAGRYHSLYADKSTIPAELKITAETEDGIIMAIEHRQLPIWAVQFHPESLMTLKDDIGLRIIQNVMRLING
ncbi:MAG: anthranilate synthase component I [Gammaproteobacteria bacterium]